MLPFAPPAFAFGFGEAGRATMLIRHLLAVVLLPFTMTIVIPVWIARSQGIVAAMGESLSALAIQAAGVVVLGAGLILFASSLRRFAVEGKGTLAPWDPPRALVVAGPYRYVRNPMISGVVLVLASEALILRSWPHAIWAASFAALAAVHFPLVEEPQLARRFGEPYREYCRNVPRLIPRLTPWTPDR